MIETKYLLPIAVGLLLSGCNSSNGSAHTESGFQSVFGTSLLDGPPLFMGVSGGQTNSDREGYAYEVGEKFGFDEGFAAYAGVTSNIEVETLPSSGSATYTGDYEAARISGIELDGNTLRGTASSSTSEISLNADFAGQTLTGSSNDGYLIVDGVFSNNSSLGGSVTYQGVAGELQGAIGGDEAIAAFHGKDKTNLIAGGFIVTAPESP